MTQNRAIKVSHQFNESTDFSQLNSKHSPNSTLNESQNNSFEIDVKPKPRSFGTPQEKQKFVEDYTRKKKTELCKNFSIQGRCKFGNQCSFAHGTQELAPKQHLHTNYKSQPCKRFFSKGICLYGNRCQYIHNEIKDQLEFREYIEKVYSAAKLKFPLHPKFILEQERSDIQRFRKETNALNLLCSDELFIRMEFKRLSFFDKMDSKPSFCEQFEKLILDPSSNGTSRKLSALDLNAEQIN